MLTKRSVCTPLIAKYTAVLAAFLDFRYSSLVSPFFHCFRAFHFSFAALSTSFQHQVSLCHGHPPCVHSHISSAASRSQFWYIPKCYPFLQESVDISLTLPIQIPFAQQYLWTSKFPFLEYRWVWQVLLIQPNHRQITCVLITLWSSYWSLCVLDVFQLCSPNKDEVNLCMTTSRWKSNKPAFIILEESVGNCKLVGYTKIKNAQPILVLHTIPTDSMNTLELCRVFAIMSIEITTKY